jgi:hypothetical protein
VRQGQQQTRFSGGWIETQMMMRRMMMANPLSVSISPPPQKIRLQSLADESYSTETIPFPSMKK